MIANMDPSIHYNKNNVLIYNYTINNVNNNVSQKLVVILHGGQSNY